MSGKLWMNRLIYPHQITNFKQSISDTLARMSIGDRSLLLKPESKKK